ncbi:hypothetical protein EUX98_g569 [Antrodiella citrinella]|uniref:Uncharacterized protein n=1 Tax=Antrodiella citrinella TaxID=2447956 RepID=A0A4S4N647_9APHY|nr:hypothetical protein EUX98_g569 [Antrodiella citrinella]
MLFMIIVSLFVALALCCLLLPSIWASITGDELLDAHEAGLALVASRNPVRETGPPACMAKLIMLRHKVLASNVPFATAFRLLGASLESLFSAPGHLRDKV